jgi:molecular chaperone IbpA|tara:strand:+ start:1695 stop:2150 length:456 start_codon:yes stop_codon:yes gene_type:complete
MTNARLHVPRSLFLGFEGLFDDLERIHSSARSGDNYPPHNVVKVDDENFLIELAVAGFTENDLNVEVKEGILKIAGDIKDQGNNEYVHKGISSRRFEKSFRISEFVVIDDADLRNGILVVKARVEFPEEKRPRKINIGSAGTSTEKTFIQD